MRYYSIIRTFIAFIIFFLFYTDFCSAQILAHSVVADKLKEAEAVNLDGFIGKKLDASYTNRILAQNVDKFIMPFKSRMEERCWQTEFWGKWFTSAILAYRYRPEPELKSVLDRAVQELLETQTKDGYIGNYTAERRLEGWDIWGRKYVLLGLIAYYDLTKDKKSLQAGSKLADHLIRELREKNAILILKGGHRGMAASSILEPITLLYARTNNKHYLNFAEEIVKQWESPDGPKLISKSNVDVGKRFPKPTERWMSWEQGQKAYEMMSCYEGLLELYRITGKQLYRTAVENTWENIHKTEINIAGSGASTECWYGGRELQTQVARHYQETCVTATWIKLSQQLLKLTGNAKYAHAIEKSYYNALLSSMKPDGSTWAKYSPLIGVKSEGGDQCNMGSNCCIVSGPRGLFTLPHTVAMSTKEGIVVNFFNEGLYQLETPRGQKISVTQHTDYPVSGKIDLRIELPKAENFTIKVRIPEWSKESKVLVNGQAVTNFKPGEYLSISRAWSKGDLITLDFDMRGRIIQMGDAPGFAAILRGPLVFARDSRLDEVDVDEIIQPAISNDGFFPMELVEVNKNNIWMSFSAPAIKGSYLEGELGQPVTLMFCDYASAGNTYNQDSRFRVWFPQLYDPRKITGK